MKSKRVLILYYSFSSQTRKLLNAMAEGMREEGVEVIMEPLQTISRLRFPIGSYGGTVKAMITTFFRQKIAIKPLSEQCRDDWNLVVLGGPTWSFQPSGPILSLLQKETNGLFLNQNVLPVISCRAFWKSNYLVLKRKLRGIAREVHAPIVFLHTIKEPWCTIGLFLKVAGRKPESPKNWISRYYPRYGHTSEQLLNARAIGQRLGKQLGENGDLKKLDYPVPCK